MKNDIEISSIKREIHYIIWALQQLDFELQASAAGYPNTKSDIAIYFEIERHLSDLKLAQEHLNLLNEKIHY